MRLSRDPAPARFKSLGIERAQRVLSGLHGRFGIGEVELSLPVRSLRGGKFLLRSPQLRKWCRTV